ncbi:MAG: YiiD C-terminal domain-containing protein [Alphaproteobacteria bacterium]|nr:YiiD C-terminal domain-containing protein [Alphaproteobacteria bacterium]
MDLEKMAASIRQQFPIYENAGLEILRADEVFKARVILGEKTQNHVHMMHAAFLFLGGEFLGGLVPMRHLKHPQKFQPVVRDLKIDFKAPALTSITAQAHFSQAQADEMNQQLEETGRFDFTLVAELTDEAGNLVAQTTANYALRNFSGK